MPLTKGNIILKRYEKLKSARMNWDAHWEDIANFIIPKKDNIYGFVTKGDKKHNMLFDGTSIHVNELLASALHGLLTNPSIQFFDFTTRDADVDGIDEVMVWKQLIVRKIHQVLANSNFHTEIHEIFLDLGSFGTGLLRISEDDLTLVRFDSKPIYEAYIQENNLGIIDTVYRKFKWTAKQIVEEFGEEKTPKSVTDKLIVAPAEEFEIIHAVGPRDNALSEKQAGSENPKGFPFASFHVLVKDGTVLKESGFREFPYAVPRWSKISGEIYGRSPGMKALPDIRMLNQVMKTTIRAAQNVIAPPLMVPDDGAGRPVNMRPNGINYYRAGTQDRIAPIVTNGRIDLGEAMAEQIRMRVRQAFFIDQLQLNEGPQMTATEVVQRTEEKVRLLAPILSRLNAELLSPLVERVYGILLRKGEIPEPPQEIAGRNLEVVFSSTIAKAQKSAELETITRLIQTTAPILQAQPESMDNFDGDGTLRYVGQVLNAPTELFRTKREVKKIREGRQQQAQQAEQAAQEQHDAEVVNKIG